jgi:hypothetical protein
VVVFAVELPEFRAHLRAQPTHDPLARVEHLPVEDVPPVPRNAGKVNVETAHDAAVLADIRVWFPAWRHRYELISD